MRKGPDRMVGAFSWAGYVRALLFFVSFAALRDCLATIFGGMAAVLARAFR